MSEVKTVRELYLCHQVYDRHYNQICRGVFGASFFCISVVIISASFALIKFQNDIMSFSLLIATWFCCVVLFKYNLRLSLNLHRNSKNIISSALRNPNAQTKYNRRFWKSRNPIYVWVGQLFSLETPSFELYLFGTVIFNSVVNLLLIFR